MTAEATSPATTTIAAAADTIRRPFERSRCRAGCLSAFTLDPFGDLRRVFRSKSPRTDEKVAAAPNYRANAPEADAWVALSAVVAVTA